MNNTLIGRIGRISRIGQIIFLAAVAGVLPLQANQLVTSTVDSGGGRSTSADYTVDSSIGWLGGICIAEGQVVRHEYIGQLTEVTGVSITGTPSAIYEGESSQLSAVAVLDDETVVPLSGAEVTWLQPSWPIANIDSNGVATAGIVYADTPGAVKGAWWGVIGAGTIFVLDGYPDNFGSYAGDGLPDWWQAQYFGLDNPKAAPGTDPDTDGQDNLYEFMAGAVPTNASSVFRFRIEPVPGEPSQKRLIFGPCAPDRIYTVLYCVNLVGEPAWMHLVNKTVTETMAERTVTDLDATNYTRFYRIKFAYHPDSLGSYAGDGLPDWWQVQYFGLNNPDAGPNLDPDGDGQNNLFEFVAGLDPTNTASVFRVRIEPVSGQPDQAKVIFGPCVPDRTYTVLFATDLAPSTQWHALTNVAVTSVTPEYSVTNHISPGGTKFYRIQISYP